MAELALLELLTSHQRLNTALLTVENRGVPISKSYPHLAGFCDIVVLDPGDRKGRTCGCGIHGHSRRVGMKLAPEELKRAQGH